MQAMLTTSDMNQDNGLYPDSDATKHLTNNFNNLEVSSNYTGGNQMQVGNAAGLSISHYGYSSFNSSN